MDFQLEHVFDEGNRRWDIAVSGEIDIFNSADLKTELTKLYEEKNADLYLRCGKLEYIDSTGLGALVGVLNGIKGGGYSIHLAAVKPNIVKLFKITNLESVFVMEDGADNG